MVLVFWSVMTVALPLQESLQPASVNTPHSSDFSAKWRREKIERPFADRFVSQVDFSKVGIEAVVRLNRASFDVWMPNGQPHPDYEKYLRRQVPYPRSFLPKTLSTKKVRYVVLNMPGPSTPDGGESRTDISFSTSTQGLFSTIADDPYAKGVRQRFVPVVSDEEDRFASLKAFVSVTEYSQRVKPVVGSRVHFAGKEYSVAEVKPFRKADFPSDQHNDSWSRLYRTVVVFACNGSDASHINAKVSLTRSASESPRRQLFVDTDGNITLIGPMVSSNISGIIPFLHRLNPNEEGKITFVSNLNLHSLEGIQLIDGITFRAWLDNIRLDPNT